MSTRVFLTSDDAAERTDPGEYVEHFMFQDPARPHRRAALKQEVADVGRCHRLDVIALPTLAATMSRVNPHLYESKHGSREQQQQESVFDGR